MNILYVEDEEVKAKEVLASLDEKCNVDFRKSLSGGLSAIQENQYDVVLLDMSLPLYDYDSEDEDENDFETFAGIDILEELMRKSRNDKVVVITAFDILGEGENEITMPQLDANPIISFRLTMAILIIKKAILRLTSIKVT